MSLVPLTDADRKAFRSVCGINLPVWYPSREKVAASWAEEVRRKSERYYARKARRAQSQADAGR